jgi:cytochrome c biogenesis protein CcmG, thiol:disulfide interchange protein DsbE
VRWTRARIINFGLTTLAVGALLALLWVRLLAASQAVASQPPPSPLIGHRAPDFALTLWNGTPGQRVHLADLRGKIVVVNYWASWCEPCQQEAKILQAAWQKYQADGVVFLGVSYQDKPADALAFLKQHGITYPSGPDDQDGSIAIAYGVAGVPETAFINRSGVVAQKINGPLDERTLEGTLAQLLK